MRDNLVSCARLSVVLAAAAVGACGGVKAEQVSDEEVWGVQVNSSVRKLCDSGHLIYLNSGGIAVVPDSPACRGVTGYRPREVGE